MIVSVVNLKGGVGKTTTAFYFAEAAKEEGHTPVVIDADSERSVLEWSSQGELSFEVIAAQKDALARQARNLEKEGKAVIIDTPLNNREAALWLAAESLTVEYAGEQLASYEVKVDVVSGELKSVGRPRLYETSHQRSWPQQRLFALDSLGEGGWLKVMKLAGYAPRGPRRRPQALQQALFPYADAL